MRAAGISSVVRPAMMSDWTLTAADRCDAKACNARAYIRVTVRLETSDLFFCNHHGRKYKDKLIAICHDYVDESAAMFA